MSSYDKKFKLLNSQKDVQNLDRLIENINGQTLEARSTDSLPNGLAITAEAVTKRLDFLLKTTRTELPFLTGKKQFNELQQLEGNIENYIGMAMVPTGVIGPVRVTGSTAKGDYYVPLATSEGALIASYHRGAKACYLAGGATSLCLLEGVQRSPVFKFKNLSDLGVFLMWVFEQLEILKGIAEQCSRFAKLNQVKTSIEGNHLTLCFEYYTGDAAGQNMVTICTDEICRYLIAHAPVQPVFWFIEGNSSGDKKATAQSLNYVRGKKVTTEITIPRLIIEEVLKTSPELMHEYWQTSTIGTIQSGSIGSQGHYANALAALFLATGQDVACISEAAVGITRIEVTDTGDLYASITMPNLIVGTVGGGTSLPTQKECLQLMDCYGAGNARKFAEICGAVVLAGELSIAAALSAGHFCEAHKKLGRKK